jgi:hypothetical protein
VEHGEEAQGEQQNGAISEPLGNDRRLPSGPWGLRDGGLRRGRHLQTRVVKQEPLWHPPLLDSA